MKKKAFTLVEVIIAAGILALILTFIIPFMRDTQKMSALSTAKGTLRQEAQMALRAMEKDISASRVKFDGLHEDGTEKYISTIDFSSSKLELEVSKQDDSTSALLFESADDDDSNYVKVTYTWGDGRLRRSHPTEGQAVFARHIKSIKNVEESSIKYDGKVTIEVTTEMEVQELKNTSTHVEQLTVAVRQLQNKFLEGMPPDMDSRSNRRWRQKFIDDGSKN